MTHIPYILHTVFWSGVIPMFFKKPRKLKACPIPTSFLDRIHADEVSRQSWIKDPLQVALELIRHRQPYFFEGDVKISASRAASALAVVSIHEQLMDDVTYAMFSVVKLTETPPGAWVPISYETCWKGRGSFGWSTKQPR